MNQYFKTHYSMASLLLLSFCSSPVKAQVQGQREAQAIIQKMQNLKNSYQSPSGSSNYTRKTRNSNKNTNKISQAELDNQKRLNEAHTANEQGVVYFNKQDYANALIAFQEAVAKNPASQTIKDNLYNAQQNMLAQQQEQLRIQQQEHQAQQNKAAVLKMQQSVQAFTKTLNTLPSTEGSTTNGLHFEELKKQIEVDKTISIKSTSAEAISNFENTKTGIIERDKGKLEFMKAQSGIVFDTKDLTNKGSIADVIVKVGIIPMQEKTAREYLAKNDKDYQARQLKLKEVKEQVAKLKQKDDELSKTINDYKKNYAGKTAPKEEFTKFTKAIEAQQTVKGQLWNAKSSEKTIVLKDEEAVKKYVTFGRKEIPKATK